jgi:hypothetical protein
MGAHDQEDPAYYGDNDSGDRADNRDHYLRARPFTTLAGVTLAAFTLVVKILF